LCWRSAPNLRGTVIWWVYASPTVAAAGVRWDGWTLGDDDSLTYFRDRGTYRPIAEMLINSERVIVYECSWVCIVQPDRSFEVARMD
jgi:hypothetical protein